MVKNSTLGSVALVLSQLFVFANLHFAAAFTSLSFSSDGSGVARTSRSFVVSRTKQLLPGKTVIFRRNLLLSAAVNDDNEENSPQRAEEKSSSGSPSWLKEAMGTSYGDVGAPPIRIVSKLSPGISGFAVDPSLGFCAILAGNDNDNSQQRATYAVIAPTDTKRVSTPEALCLVQLAGGLDLGTGVLPPDALARLVITANDEVEKKDDESPVSVEELRKRISLVRVDVVPNEDGIAAVSKKEKDKQESSSADSSLSSPERNDKIIETAPKVHDAVKRLPGLTDVSLEDVISAMKLHTNEEGNVDRDAFAQILDTLRDLKNNIQPSLVKFQLTVNVVSDNSITQETIENVPPFMAVGLALRYQKAGAAVPLLIVSKESLDNGFDAEEILERFPAFRPFEELVEDAKIMDGFIPSMFMEASQPPPENDQKM